MTERTPSSTSSTAALYECEAESVAYVTLAGMAGLDTSAYSVGYVTSWTGGDVEALRSTAENVLRAVHTRAAAIVEDDQDGQDPGGSTAA